ncbi:hypothetical protein BGW80DRAFT_1273599 [Lactifluus volemus]|nr:hypothetical protein BGW80DRAFT_1273599 [Lactifluus volemus]
MPPRGVSSRVPRPNRGNHQKRGFEHIPSISRSSGIEHDGDTLKDLGVQDEYRQFLQQKLDTYWKQYPSESSAGSTTTPQKSEIESNILIQFRKLREGISSSQRHDRFAIEAYETSLWLSIIFHSHAQTTSILSRLLPDLYLKHMTSSSCLAILAACLHSLDLHYPSQRAYFDLLKSLPPSIPLRKDHQLWLRELSCSLRRGGYSQFRRLTQMSSLVRLVAPETHDQVGPSIRPRSCSALVTNSCRKLAASSPPHRVVHDPQRISRVHALDIRYVGVAIRRTTFRSGNGKTRFPWRENHVELWFVSREKLGEVGRKEDHARWAVKTKK